LTYQDALRQDVVLRHPFSDRDLHEFCLSLGPHHRSRWYAGRILPKFLLRLAYVGDLPPDIISSEVRTPYASVSEQYCLHNREELSELFSSKSCLARLGILDSVAIEEILLDAGLIQKHSRSFVRMSGVEMWLRSLAREPLQGGKCSPTPATPLPAELVGVREQQAKRVGVLVPREGVLARTINVATIMVDTSTLEVCRLDEEGVHYWQALCSAPTWPRVFAQLQQTYPESDLNEIKKHARHFADLLVAQGWAVVNKKEEEEIDGICALDCNCI
jgi:hypothetical protein